MTLYVRVMEKYHTLRTGRTTRPDLSSDPLCQECCHLSEHYCKTPASRMPSFHIHETPALRRALPSLEKVFSGLIEFMEISWNPTGGWDGAI